MSISLPSIMPINQDAELDGPTFRLSPEQYQRMQAEAILLDGDTVELREGILHLVNTSADNSYYRLSTALYDIMVKLGILTKDDRVELLEGWLVAKMSKDQPHEIVKGSTQDALLSLVLAGWFVSIETPVSAIDSKPEPDLVIVRGLRRDYLVEAPGPLNVALVVEVADSSLYRDRSIKKRLYARSSFPIYWLINLIDGRIEVYTDPSGPTESAEYGQRQDFGPDDLIPVVIEGREVGRLMVRDLLP